MSTGDRPLLVDRELAALESAIAAQYDIIRPLGRGGMGAVYLARERLLDRLVAIKVLRTDHQLDDESRERFLREARTAARLTHPNIVPLYSFGQSGDTVFYVMGYVDGESLETYLQRAGRVAPVEVGRIVADLADALDYAHQRGVVHRDIKPDNILLERATGRAILTDFGIARLTTGGALTRTGVIIGTPQYMSPEQAAGDRDVDGRSDLYSLGVVGYRMLSGRLPFESLAVQELLAQHLTKRPPPLGNVAENAPAGIAAAIMRCLEKDPRDRFSNGAALRVAVGTGASHSLALPDGLEHHASFGVGVAATSFGIAVLGATVFGATHDVDWIWFGGAGAALTPVLIVGPVIEAKRAGMSLTASLRALFAAPARLTTWWPRSLRRPGDVWDRLPAPVRVGRAIMGAASAGLVLMMGFCVPAFIGGMTGPIPNIAVRAIQLVAFSVVVALIAVMGGAVAIRRWARAASLSSTAQRKMMSEPTWGSTFWSRPEIESLLASPDTIRPMSDSAPRSVPALIADIELAVAGLAHFDAKLADDVLVMAREVGAAMNAMEKEIVDLDASVQLEEVQRLAERLEVSSAPDDPAMRQMRALVANQLELMKGLQERQRTLERRHDRAFTCLQTLWLQLRALRAHRPGDSPEATDITGRIRALCADVAHLNTAIHEVDAITALPSRSAR